MHIWHVYYEPINDNRLEIPEIKEHLGDFPAFFSNEAKEEASIEYDIHEDDLTVEY